MLHILRSRFGQEIREISGLHREVNENCALLGYYGA